MNCRHWYENLIKLNTLIETLQKLEHERDKTLLRFTQEANALLEEKVMEAKCFSKGWGGLIVGPEGYRPYCGF